jgi:hypothetical protein
MNHVWKNRTHHLNGMFYGPVRRCQPALLDLLKKQIGWRGEFFSTENTKFFQIPLTTSDWLAEMQLDSKW